MPALAYRARGVRVLRSGAVASLLCAAAILTACSSDTAVHTGALPANPPPAVAPHVIESVPLEGGQAPIVAGPPREVAFGITEDQLPLGLTVSDLELGMIAAVALLIAGTFGLVLSALLRSVVGRRGRTTLAAAQQGASAGAGTVVLQMQQLQMQQRAEPAQRAPARAAPVHASALEVPLNVSPAIAKGSGLALDRVGAIARSTARGTRAAARGGASAGHAGQHLAKWGSKVGRAAWRSLASAPRHAWSDFERRRSPFSDGGAFWLRGTEMLRMGVQSQAEHHYWTGFYECENRGWDVEGAECLRCLAHIAAQRGDVDEALRHLESAQLLLERTRSRARLEQVRGELAQLTGLVPARSGSTAPV